MLGVPSSATARQKSGKHALLILFLESFRGRGLVGGGCCGEGAETPEGRSGDLPRASQDRRRQRGGLACVRVRARLPGCSPSGCKRCVTVPRGARLPVGSPLMRHRARVVGAYAASFWSGAKVAWWRPEPCAGHAAGSRAPRSPGGRLCGVWPLRHLARQ